MEISGVIVFWVTAYPALVETMFLALSTRRSRYFLIHSFFLSGLKNFHVHIYEGVSGV